MIPNGLEDRLCCRIEVEDLGSDDKGLNSGCAESSENLFTKCLGDIFPSKLANRIANSPRI